MNIHLIKEVANSFITLSLLQKSHENNLSVDFNDLLTCPVNLSLEDFKCNACSKVNIRIEQKIEYSLESNKYLVIRLSRIFNGIYCRKKITNLMKDEIFIPQDQERNIYKLKSIISHLPTDYNNTDEGGHFICLRNNDQSWLKISDCVSELVKQIEEESSNFYLLFLEKKIKT